MKQRRVGLIGAGNVGHALAQRLVKLGHWVQVANSRGPQSLQEFERQTGATAVELPQVATQVELLVLAIPLSQVPAVRAALPPLPQGVVVIDAGNYIPQRDGVIADIVHGLPETAWVAAQLGMPMVKAFNNIIAQGLVTNGKPAGAPDRIALPVAGDEPTARASIRELVEQLGFTAFDAGTLADSWRQQPGQPAYCTDPTLAELPHLLAQANATKGAHNRDKAMQLLAKLPLSFPASELVRVSRLSVGLDRWKLRSWGAILHLALTLLRA